LPANILTCSLAVSTTAPVTINRPTFVVPLIQVSLLHILVEQHSKDVQGKVRVNWDTVSRLINRRYYDCQNKWNTIKKSNLKVRACASSRCSICGAGIVAHCVPA
jgi:hypothetical protein